MQKLKSFRPWQPEQTTLLPPSPSDWLSDAHQVWFLLDLVDELHRSKVQPPAVLTANQQPDHSRISQFRCRNIDALSEMFVQILRLGQKADMVILLHVALDGTEMQANASKHKATNGCPGRNSSSQGQGGPRESD